MSPLFLFPRGFLSRVPVYVFSTCLLSLERELPEGRALPLLFPVDSSAPCSVPGAQQVFGGISRNALELEVATGWKFVLVNNQGPFSYQLPLVPESPLPFCPSSFHFC